MAPSKDMTQRVHLEGAGQGPARRTGSHTEPPHRDRKKKRWFMTRKEKIVLISLASVTAVLLIAAIIMISTMFAAPADDGKILKGVVAAGVNLGGMTPEEAAAALEDATADTYTKLDMVVTVLDSQISLSPKDTGAKLNIQGVVEDAYNYGRTGSRAEQAQAKSNALENSVIIPIVPHLNLDTDFIRSQINKLGTQFSSALTQPTITLTGTKPPLGVSKPDTVKVHQTLSIYVGTAEYGLDTGKLYNQVLEYYNINIFQVVGVCTVVAPDSIEDDLLTYYQELCTEPVDAQIDPVTYDVTPEVYGYGFNLDAVKEQIAKAAYGSTVEVYLSYLAPNLTEELISGNLFKDVLGDYSSPLGTDAAWNSNIEQACKKLNGLIIKSGEIFSFNDVLGKLTADAGWQEALAYQGKFQVNAMGGGVSHAASVLYNSVLEAELEILEHHNHTYATTFIEAGRDAYVAEGKANFSFRNNRPEPIRINAEVEGDHIIINIEGSDTRNYRVEISTKVTKTIQPGKLMNVMYTDNPGGYKNGQVLSAGINGYEVELYGSLYSKDNSQLQNKRLIGTATYSARDSVVVKLQNNPAANPSEPSGTTPSTDPSQATTGPAASTGNQNP